MIDKENSNIHYKQINIPLVLLIVLFCALYVMGLCFSVFYLIANAIDLKNNPNLLGLVILLSFLSVYLVYAFVVNVITFRKVMKLEWDTKPKLYLLFLYSSLDIPSGIIMSVLLRRQKNEEDQ